MGYIYFKMSQTISNLNEIICDVRTLQEYIFIEKIRSINDEYL